MSMICHYCGNPLGTSAVCGCQMGRAVDAPMPPVKELGGYSGNAFPHHHLTLRDQALTGLLAARSGSFGLPINEIPSQAYQVADAMLAVRDGKKP